MTVKGHNLHDISNHLKACKLAFIRLGGNVTAFEVRKLETKK